MIGRLSYIKLRLYYIVIKNVLEISWKIIKCSKPKGIGCQLAFANILFLTLLLLQMRFLFGNFPSFLHLFKLNTLPFPSLQEHHLQRAISAQQVYGEKRDSMVIPVPEAECNITHYESLYPGEFKMPKQLIHLQRE